MLNDISQVTLHPGINRIPAFTPDGKEATIILGWRDNGNAWGENIAFVLVPGEYKEHPTEVVKFNGLLVNDIGTDFVADSPHMGDDAVVAFRFARGKVNGVPYTLLLKAERNLTATVPAPSPVTFTVYRLELNPDVGTTPYHFSPVIHDRSRGWFCNAEMALSKRFGISLAAGYEGPPTSNGCPAATSLGHH